VDDDDGAAVVGAVAAMMGVVLFLDLDDLAFVVLWRWVDI
jgi:hypothetical protein